MKNLQTKRILAILLALVLTLGMLPTSAFAARIVDDEVQTTAPVEDTGNGQAALAVSRTVSIKQTYGTTRRKDAGSKSITLDSSYGYTMKSPTTYASTPSGYTFSHFLVSCGGNGGVGPAGNQLSKGVGDYWSYISGTCEIEIVYTGGSSSGGSGSGSGSSSGASGSHSVSCNFTVLYVDSSFNIGYNYGGSYSTTFNCQYSNCNTTGAYSNHCIALSDIGAARSHVSVDSGYSIVGWSKSASANPTINTTWTGTGYGSGGTTLQKNGTIYLVAKRSSTTYTLSYNLNGGSGSFGSQTSGSTTASSWTTTVKSTKPTKEGYTFTGWYGSDGNTYQPGNSITLSSNVTLTAQWSQNQDVTLTYYDRGSVYATDTKATGSTFTVKDCTSTRQGYTFLGWSSSSTATTADWEVGDTMRLSADAELHAVWEASNKVHIIYKPGVGGTGGKTEEWNEATRTVKGLYGAGITAKADNTFAQFYLGDDGNIYEPGDDILQPASDLTLTAIWKTQGSFPVTVNFVGLDDGTQTPAVTLSYRAYLTLDGTQKGSAETGSITLTKQSDGSYTGTITPTVWSISSQWADTAKSRFKNVVEISEDLTTAAVTGYTFGKYSAQYSADGTNVTTSQVRFTMPGDTTGKTLALKNTYTKITTTEGMIRIKVNFEGLDAGDFPTDFMLTVDPDKEGIFAGSTNTPGLQQPVETVKTGTAGALPYAEFRGCTSRYTVTNPGTAPYGTFNMSPMTVGTTYTQKLTPWNTLRGLDNYEVVSIGGTKGATYATGSFTATADMATGNVPEMEFTIVYAKKQVTVTWYDEDGTTRLDGPTEFTKGGTEPAYSGATPTKDEDENYTYAFKEWVKMADSTEDEVKYKATYTATAKPQITVKYVTDDETPVELGSWSYKAAAGTAYDHTVTASAGVPSTGNATTKSPKSITAGGVTYAYDKVATTDALTGSVSGDATITVVYSLDAKGTPGTNPNGEPTDDPNGTPDKYEVKVTFHVVNGQWNDRSTADIVEYLPKYKEGALAEDGAATLGEIFPTAGNRPDAGYRAGAWDTTPTAATTITTDTTFTYTYVTAATHVVTWLDEDGTQIAQKTFQDGQPEPGQDFADPTKEADEDYTYEFDGWNRTEENGDITYTATYAPTARPKATVTWYDEDETTVLVPTVTFNKGTTEPTTDLVPTKAEDANNTYAFARWERTEDSTEDEIKYKAVYTPTAKYEVKWVDGDNVIDTADEKITDPTDLPEFTGELPEAPEGKEFDKWGDPVVNEDDHTIEIPVVWKDKEPEPKELTVKWVNWDGTELDSKTFNEGETEPEKTIENPTRPSDATYNYSFKEWEKTVDENGNITYTAVYDQTRRSTGGGGRPSNPPEEDLDDPDVPLADLPMLNQDDHFAYIIGKPDGNVHPLGNITRAEVVTIFFRIMTEEARTEHWGETNDFSDVDAGTWYNHAVCTAVNAGLIKGLPDGTFGGDRNITRAEFATIAARFLDTVVQPAEKFTDIEGHWAETDIDRATAAGWIKGVGDGKFNPDAYITRAEVMTLVNRMLNRKFDATNTLEDMVVWPDNMDKDAWYYGDVQEATNDHDYDREEGTLTETWTAITEPRDWSELEK